MAQEGNIMMCAQMCQEWRKSREAGGQSFQPDPAFAGTTAGQCPSICL